MDCRLWMTGEISAEITAQVADKLLEIEGDEEWEGFPAYVFVGGPGGDPSAALSLGEIFQVIDREVITVAWGEVQSAAVLVFLAGQRRLVSPHSSFMVHGASVHWPEGGMVSTPGHARGQAEFLTWISQQGAELTGRWARAMGCSVSRALLNSADDTWFLGGEAAIQLGLATGWFQSEFALDQE